MEESIWFDQHDFEEAEAVYQLYLVRKDTALGHTSATRVINVYQTYSVENKIRMILKSPNQLHQICHFNFLRSNLI